jgi:Fe-S-cluster containining protein
VKSPYEQFVSSIDELSALLSRRYHQHLACRDGCSGCCHHHLSVFPVEAATLKEAIDKLPPEQRSKIEAQARETIEREQRGEAVSCPLLVEDRCSVYASRPFICRTQGLPLLIEAEDGELEVDFCPLNFTAPAATDDLDGDYLVPLDRLNLSLAQINLEFCRTDGVPDQESGKRPSIADIILGKARSGEEVESGKWKVESGKWKVETQLLH